MVIWLFLVGVPLLLITPAWVLAARRRRRWPALGAVFLGMVLGAVLGWVAPMAYVWMQVEAAGSAVGYDIGIVILFIVGAIIGSIAGAWIGLGVSALLDRRRVPGRPT